MAVTKIWRVRGKADQVIDYASNPEKTKENLSEEELADIADVLEYADDAVKTEAHYYTTGINCDKARAKEEFSLTKTRFGKQGGIVAIHGYQSFEEEDLSPEEAHVIGVQLARELWGDQFQVIVATHLNTGHVHNHFVINSVSYKDGKRFHMCTDRYLELKDASDRLCREHQLSVIEHPSGKGRNYRLHQMEQAGMPTRYSVARAAIDAAISRSVNMEEFKHEMKMMGYKIQFNPNRKYWTVTIPGWEKPIRIHRLGEDYTKERIMERVYENDISVRQKRLQMYEFRPNGYRMPGRIHRINARTGLEKLYLRICYEMGYLPRYRQDPLKVHAIFKDELLKCDLYAREARLLATNHISTDEDMTAFEQGVKEKMTDITARREELRKLVKRSIPEEHREHAKAEITELTSQLKEMRSQLRLCGDIRDRSSHLAEKLQIIDKERTKEREVRKK